MSVPLPKPQIATNDRNTVCKAWVFKVQLVLTLFTGLASCVSGVRYIFLNHQFYECYPWKCYSLSISTRIIWVALKYAIFFDPVPFCEGFHRRCKVEKGHSCPQSIEFVCPSFPDPGFEAEFIDLDAFRTIFRDSFAKYKGWTRTERYKLR